MKYHLSVAVLCCALVSLSYANVAEEEQSLPQLEQVPQNEEKAVVVEEKVVSAVLPKVETSLLASDQMPSDGNEEIANEPIEKVIPADVEQMAVASNREPKQLIGFIPTYVLRQAIRLAQEQEPYNFRALSYEVEDDDDDASNEIEEERAIRRRKRIRRRNSKGHLKKSRRHKNANKQVNKRRKIQSQKRKTPKRKPQKRGSQKKGSKNKKKKKINRYEEN